MRVVIVGLFILCLASTSLACIYYVRVMDQLTEIKHTLEEALQLTDSWVSNGVTKTVMTTQRFGEALEDFFARHDEAVSIRKGQCPPD